MQRLVERNCTQEWKTGAVTTVAQTLSGSIVHSYLCNHRRVTRKLNSSKVMVVSWSCHMQRTKIRKRCWSESDHVACSKIYGAWNTPAVYSSRICPTVRMTPLCLYCICMLTDEMWSVLASAWHRDVWTDPSQSDGRRGTCHVHCTHIPTRQGAFYC